MFTAKDARCAIADAEQSFREIRQKLAEWRVTRSSELIDEIDSKLETASAAFRARCFDEAEQLLFDVQMSVRKLAGQQRDEERQQLDQALATVHDKLEFTLQAMLVILTRTEELTSRGLRKTKRKTPPKTEPEAITPRWKPSESEKTAWIVAGAAVIVALYFFLTLLFSASRFNLFSLSS